MHHHAQFRVFFFLTCWEFNPGFQAKTTINRFSCSFLICLFSMVVSVPLSQAVVPSKTPIEFRRSGICYCDPRELMGEKKVIWRKG